MSWYALVVGVGVSAMLAGGWLIIAGAQRRPPVVSRTRRSRVRAGGARTADRQRLWRWAAAVAAGGGVWLVSGWPVAGVLVGFGVIGLPYFFGAARIAATRIDRLEALEEWTRRLADAMSSGSAPVQTIVRSAERAPEPIAAAVRELAAGLGSPRHDRAAALRRFAADLDDSLGDMVVLALEIALSAQASQRVPDVLRAVAGEVSEEVRARRKVETDRAEPRNEARTIVVIQILFVIGVSVLTTYTQVYGTVTGQLVLAALGGGAVLALVLLRRFGLTTPPPRLLPDEAAVS